MNEIGKISVFMDFIFYFGEGKQILKIVVTFIKINRVK